MKSFAFNGSRFTNNESQGRESLFVIGESSCHEAEYGQEEVRRSLLRLTIHE
ncbi:MAG: hypothetical protein K0S79_25 [Nitrospira sp.]|jgi:hypothetical protein|nr:hypothetical protein [Nitrospira sp.]